MEIQFLTEYTIPIIVGICLCTGYILKNVLVTNKINQYIPLAMGSLGVILNIWISKTFTPSVLLGGLFSGLASTGLHQLFKNLIQKQED